MLKLILAVILALPSLLIIICLSPILGLLSIPSLLLLLLKNKKESSGISTKNPPNHVIIVGGSSGIGLCIAKDCIQRFNGDRSINKITILARNKNKLQIAKNELQTLVESKSKSSKSTEIYTISVNVSDYQQLEHVVKTQIKWDTTTTNNNNNERNERTVLFNCAGFSYTTEFENIPHNILHELVLTNQLGNLYIVKACLPYINQGVICLTSSIAGQAAVYGYSGYNPTKCSIRGFAEVMTQELLVTKPKVHIQVAYPEDNKTPDHEKEIQMMPNITKILNGTATLWEPEDTAKIMVNNAFQSYPKFAVYFSIIGWAMANVSVGFGPVMNLSDAVTQVTLLPLLRWIALFVMNDWWNIIIKYSNNNKKKKGKKDDDDNDGNNDDDDGNEISSKKSD